MKEIGIRELKDKLSEYIRLVREEGEVVMVTDRGKVVAELRPPGRETELAKKYPKLVEMAQKGLIRLARHGNHPGLYPRFPSMTPPGTAQRLLDEERGER